MFNSSNCLTCQEIQSHFQDIFHLSQPLCNYLQIINVLNIFLCFTIEYFYSFLIFLFIIYIFLYENI